MLVSLGLHELVELEGVGEMVVELVGVAARDSACDPAYDPARDPARDLPLRGDVNPDKQGISLDCVLARTCTFDEH